MRGKLFFGAASAALLAALIPAVASAQTADPAADTSTTARLSADQPAFGELNPAGDSDWYRLTVAPGQRYDFNLDAAVAEGATEGFDTMLVLHSAGGDEIASNDDANGTLNSALSYRPSEAADVFVEARAFAEDAAGAYTLRVAATAVAPDDVGDDASTRARLTPGHDANGIIGEAGDLDWYRLSARTGQLYRIGLTGTGADNEALTDPLLTIVDREGNQLASNDDSNGSLNSFLEFVPRSNGDVFVVAQGYGEAAGAYALRVDATALPADNAGNDQSSRARLTLGQPVTGGLDYPRDTDWFRVRLNGGQTYRFAASSPDGERNFDTVVRVHNSAGEELAADDDGGVGFNSYLEFEAPETGDYFVDVSGFAEDAVGDYSLTAQAGDIPADTSTDASLSADGDYREGALAPAGDKDWYRIDLAEGQAMRIAVDGVVDVNGLGDPMLVLYGPDGAEVGRDDDGGEGLNSRLEYSAPAAGAYYLEVRGFVDDAAGRYTVSLTPGEIGDTAETAEAFSDGGEPYASQIGIAGDVDWFAVNLVEGRPYRINVESADGTFDPMLRLLDDKGVEIAADDDGGAGVNAYVSYTSVIGGTYYVAVSGFGDSTGGYGLRIADTDVPGNPGTDEVLDAAQGDDRLSSIELAGDLDAYSVNLEQGTSYEITVVGEGATPLRDPLLTILGIEGQTVASDDNSGPGASARLIFTPESTDSFYLQASGAGGSIGGYRITITPQTPRGE